MTTDEKKIFDDIIPVSDSAINNNLNTFANKNNISNEIETSIIDKKKNNPGTDELSNNNIQTLNYIDSTIIDINNIEKSTLIEKAIEADNSSNYDIDSSIIDSSINNEGNSNIDTDISSNINIGSSFIEKRSFLIQLQILIYILFLLVILI